MNSVASTRRLPDSQLYTQLCGFSNRPPRSRCVSPASSRSARSKGRIAWYAADCWAFVAIRGEDKPGAP